MKPLLLLLTFAIAALTAQAQEFEPDMQKLMKSYLEKQKGKERFAAPAEKQLPQFKPGEAHQPGVYALRQDGMPCVVPNTTDIVQIPNAMPQKPNAKLGKIPNAAEPRGLELLKGKIKDLKGEPSR